MKTLKIVAAAALLVGSQQAFAASVNGQLDVTASVGAVCEVATLPLSFGSVNPLTLDTADHDSTGTIEVTCSSGTSYTIALGNGNNYDTTNAIRQMISGTDLLQYALYSDSARTTVWDGTTMPAATTSTGVKDTHTVYGRIPAGQNPPMGSYADAVQVTVTF